MAAFFLCLFQPYAWVQPMPLPTSLQREGFQLCRPSSVNLIVGRNGSGKSRFLRGLSDLRNEEGYYVSYISPERAGTFEPDSNIENNLRQNQAWLYDVRGKNQAANFKRASAIRLKDLAVRFALRMEEDRVLRDSEKTFATEYLAKINGMLSNVSITRSGSEFQFQGRSGEVVSAEMLSSGESEVVSLATEVMYFFATVDAEKMNLLLLDEPDVHLHPDLQARFARFLLNEVQALAEPLRNRVIVCVSSHSTSLICALSGSAGCSIGTKDFDSNVVSQKPIASALQKVSTFFGHSLSKCISDDVPVIIEGEDDERVWQQAARSSQGRLKIFPCLALTVDKQGELENFCNTMLTSIYDDPIALSIRDGDGVKENLNNVGCVRRFRLQCYAIENLLLTNEVLTSLGVDWHGLVAEVKGWLEGHPSHKSCGLLSRLIESENRLRDEKIKEVRQLIPSILGSQKPWEVLVGQAIALVTQEAEEGEHSIISYLGRDTLTALGLLRDQETENVEVTLEFV